MNLPNKLTVLRFILVPVFIIFIMLPESVLSAAVSQSIAACIFAATALTDMLDGKIARKYNLVTNFGKFADPLADKFMILSALVALTAKYENTRLLLLFVTIVVMLRELAITSLRLVAANSVVIAASWLGKVKTATQCIAVLVALLEPVILKDIAFFAKYAPLTSLALVTVVFFTLYSGMDYVLQYKDFLRDA